MTDHSRLSSVAQNAAIAARSMDIGPLTLLRLDREF